MKRKQCITIIHFITRLHITNHHLTQTFTLNDRFLRFATSAVIVHACSPQTAEYDFRFALSKTKGRDPNLAYHLIQSFAPGEVSFEEAHAIGVELADQLLQGKYSYIVSTHIDKDHCHNHIIFCAADNVDHRKYHDCKQTYRQIRQLNDKLCQEHNLSVIIPGQEQGAKHNEWEAKKDGTSWKEKMRQDINDAIAHSSSYEVFLETLRAKGYEIKGENLDDGKAKYIAFRPLGKERFVRGSAKSLGPEFTRDRIIQRIEEQAKMQHQEQLSQFRKKHPIPLHPKKPATAGATESERTASRNAKICRSGCTGGRRETADFEEIYRAG